MGNVLNALPKSQQGRAKADLQAIWMAATRADAYAAFDRFVAVYAAKYPKATETLKKDRESLLAFYDFPADHWQHLRTTNAIESTFATVRHRTTRTRNCVSRPTFLGLAFKLIEEAEKTWRAHQRPRTDQAVAGGHCLQGRRTGARRSTGSAQTRRLKSPAIKLPVHQS
jgi:transposase-like protein